MHSGEDLAGAAVAGLGEDRELRLLGLALLASLVLHALILLLLPLLREAQPSRFAPPPLTAHLAKPKPPQETPRPEPPLPARPVAKSLPRAVPAPVLAIEPKAPPAEAPAFTVTPQPPAPSQPPAREAPALAAVAPAETAPDPGSLARFRLELMEIARRYKRYPRIAQDNNWEGRVELRVAFAENGAMTSVTVKKSAGRTVLDEEAQAMIRSAKARLAVPPALRGRAFALEIPVEFSLKD